MFRVGTDEKTMQSAVFDGEELVATIQSFKGHVSLELAENMADILNIQPPRHKINVGAAPNYFAHDAGFEIRIRDNGVIGEQSRAFTCSIKPEYQDRLLGRFNPDFFVALCDAMPTPPKPRRDRKPARQPAMS